MKTIQSKILFVVITALIVITAIVTSIAVGVTHKIMHKDADRILNTVSEKEAAYINDMLNDFMQSSAIMEHYALHELESADTLKDGAYLENYTQEIRHLFDEVARNTVGTTAYYLCFSPEVTNGKTTGFYSKFKNDGLYELSKEEFAELDLFNAEFIKECGFDVIGSDNTWLQPRKSTFSPDTTVVSYLAPIYKDDTFVGFLGFNMDFEYLLGLVNEITVYDNGHALLLSGDKQTCYNPAEDIHILEDYTEATTALKNGMNLELRAAYADIQSGIRPMLIYIIGAFLVVLALAILYTFWVTHRIVTPLKKLTAAAANISVGVQNVNLVIDSKDEIGVLARVLNDTYAKILEYSAYINALAYRDSLTGIKNSTAYTEAIEELNKEINLGNPSFGVIVADINNLKKTNDTYGHDIGNELIVHSARILTDTFKTSSVYRIGGDEFVVVLKGKDLERYHALIEKMDTAFSADYIAVNDETVPVSIARGVSVFDPLIDRVYTDVFAKADHAMYMNKQDMKAARI